jgi:hypothetical protein
LRIQSTAKPKSNLPAFMVLPRFSICQDRPRPWRSPQHRLDIEAGALGEMDGLGQPWTRPAMQIWLTILVSWPEPAGPISLHMRLA